MFFAFLDLIYSWSLLTLPPEAKAAATYQYVGGTVPLAAWAALWATVGLICLASAFVRRDYAGFTAAIALKIIWGIVYLAGDIAGEIFRGWVAASIWWAMSLLILLISGWPETRGGDKWTTASSSQSSP